MIFFFVVQGERPVFCCSWIKINRLVGNFFPQKFPDGVPQKSNTGRKKNREAGRPRNPVSWSKPSILIMKNN